MNNRTYYSDDNSLGIKTVVTKSGFKEYRKNCKKINHDFYIIDKECFEVEGRWYSKDSGLIIYDNELKSWVLKKDKQYAHGIVGFEKNKPIFGNFVANPYNNCFIYQGIKGNVPCSSFQLAIENGYVEDFSTSIFFKRESIDVNDAQKPKNVLDHTVKGYNIEDNVDEFAMKKKLFEEFTPDFTKDVRRYGKMLRDTTWGLEIEAAKGMLPDFIQNRTGVVICRDGSLNDANGKPGPEFVTVPMSGYKGLQTVADLCKELSKRTSLDINCSVHLHLGNLPTSRLYLLSLYKLGLKIQNEVFQMFPFYKTNPEGIKKKNYNQKLPMLGFYPLLNSSKEEFDQYVNDNYKTLFSWLSEGYEASAECNRKQKQHPVAQKWNRHQRYYWLNLMNTLFSSRNTVEFRIHTPTTNAQKVINWLFICNAIVRYANIHSNKILLSKLPITLDEILDYYGRNFGTRGKFLSEYLKAYVKSRKETFLNDYLRGDYVSQHEIINDKKYTFTHNNVSHLF